MSNLIVETKVRRKNDKINWESGLVVFLVFCIITGVTVFIWWSYSYYLTDFAQRPFHPQHKRLKPSGNIGHLFGVIGTVFILFTFIYYIRKRIRFLQTFGSQKLWLKMHIFFGISGPILIVFHSTGKLAGIAAIAFYSTFAIVLSGLVGRYIYSKIPRTKRGNEMTLTQIEDHFGTWIEGLNKGEGKDIFLESLEEYLSGVRSIKRGILYTLISVMIDDLWAPGRIVQAWRISGLQICSFSQRIRTIRLILKQRRMLKKLAVLDAFQKLFSFWHIFHRPFVLLASVVISLHIGLMIYMGYGFQW